MNAAADTSWQRAAGSVNTTRRRAAYIAASFTPLREYPTAHCPLPATARCPLLPAAGYCPLPAARCRLSMAVPSFVGRSRATTCRSRSIHSPDAANRSSGKRRYASIPS